MTTDIGPDGIDRLLKLDADKRRLLTQLLMKRAAGQIPRRPAGQSIVPCSYGQRRLWFLHELEQGAPVYQISEALPIDGALDPALLHHSLTHVVQRHEALRTTFASEDGQPMQVIAARAAPGWRLVDLSGVPASRREAEARHVAGAEAREPFDLGRGPLVRGTLIRLGPESHVLLLTLHHIVADGWSMNVLLNELGTAHDALQAGQPPPLPELPVQYADYALWQRGILTPERLAGDLAYWRRQLQGLPRVELPGAMERRGARTGRGAREFFAIEAPQARALEALAQGADATLFMALLAVIQLLLARYSGQDDVAVGSAVAGRSRPELEGLIGFFLNTVCLRTDLSGNPGFAELLGRVRETALNAYAHVDVPFELLVEELAPERSLSRAAFFDVMFVLQTNRSRQGSTLQSPAEDKNDWPLESGTSKFDLTWSIAESAGRLVGALEFSCDLLDTEGARRMIAHFLTLIDGVTADPQAAVRDVPMLTGTERRIMLREWNATAADYPADACVHELVALQAARVPEAVAIRSAAGEIRFGELDARANRLARHLRALGARPHDRIGVRMHRTPNLVASALAIWKAGGVYVPLDPDAPQDRTARIVRDADLRLVLEDPLDWSAIARQPADPLESAATPDDLAYLLYTSGSTGAPKGVMIEHRSLVSYLTWVNRHLLGLAPQLVPAIAKPSFDASLKQLFAPLLQGLPVWLVAESVVDDPARLLAHLAEAGDVTINCVPWLWKVLLEHLEAEAAKVRLKPDTTDVGLKPGTTDAGPAARVKRLLIGGEDLSQELVDRTFACLPDVELWNLYGPTETTANATAVRLLPGQRTSIGRPIANTSAYVLDAHGQPVPVGAPGELHIGGLGVARGYWGQPELTASRFVANPFGSGRLYKTGDLARYRTDGCLEFLGRVDRQVKLRGLRIELGEIEARLEQHPAIRQAAVILDESSREPRLVAYLECRNGAGGDGGPASAPGSVVTANGLRAFTRAALPDYMVPARFVFVESLPRSVHGKIDRRALPAVSSSPSDREPAAPRGPDEERVAAIWASVLRATGVDDRCNFFELGGHSLLLTQAVSRVREAFGVEIPLRAVFEDPTLRGFVDAIRRARAEPGHGASPITRID